MKISSLIILLFIATQTFSQQNKFELGMVMGAGTYSLRGSAIQEYDYNGGSIGLNFQYNATKLISIHSDIFYEKRSIIFSSSDQGVCANCPSSGYIHENLIVPVLARLNFGSKAKFFVNAGPYLGYSINNTWVNDHFDFGLASGLGGQINLNRKINISLEARNNLGLVPVEILPVFEEDNLYNVSLNLLIGITYRLDRKTMD